MARVKKPTRISATDPDFVRRLEFDLPEDRLREVEGAKALPDELSPVQEKVADEQSAKLDTQNAQRTAQTGMSSTTLPAVDPAKKSPQKSNRNLGKRKRQPRETLKAKGDVKKSTVIRLVFGIPNNLTARADKWAANARCPVNTIIQRVFAELRPALIERLEVGIKYDDVTHDRAVDATHRFNTSVTISESASVRLSEELDPEGISGLTGPLSRWAREEMLKHLEKVLGDKGY